VKRNRRGRAKGGIIMGVRKDLEKRNKEEWSEKEGIIIKRVKIRGEWWRVIGVYISEEIEKCLGELKRWMERKDEGIKTILGGDFNARTGEKGEEIRGREESEEGGERKSKDKKINREGRIWINAIEEVGWAIWNGNTMRMES